MVIVGLYGDEAIGRFRPDLHVNIYTADNDRREFYCDAEMSELPEEVTDDPESYFLEPVGEDGQPISIEQALRPEPNAGEPEKRPRLTVQRFPADNIWATTYPEGAKAPHGGRTIFELFGTNTLPTAFTAAMPAADVRRELAALNPDYEIVVIEEDGEGRPWEAAGDEVYD